MNAVGDLGMAISFPNHGVQAQLLNISLGSVVGAPIQMATESGWPVLSRSGFIMAECGSNSISVWNTRSGDRMLEVARPMPAIIL